MRLYLVFVLCLLMTTLSYASVSVSSNQINIDFDYVYKDVYVAQEGASQWTLTSCAGSPLSDLWYNGCSVDMSGKSGSYFLATYACDWTGSNFDCNNNQWRIQEISFASQSGPAVCGNGVVEAAEACDDGNKRSGDGCSSSCKLEDLWTYACSDGTDNDGDKRVDMSDPGCDRPTENDEFNANPGGTVKVDFDSRTHRGSSELGGLYLCNYPGEKSRARFDIKNKKDEKRDLYVSDVIITGKDASRFSYYIQDNRLVDEDNKLYVYVEFIPERIGEHEAEMIIKLNTEEGEKRVDLSGTGVVRIPTQTVPESYFSGKQKTDRLSQYGVHWFFDKEYEFGTFANGDYWVKGPISLEKIFVDPPGDQFNRPLCGINEFEISPKGTQKGSVPQGFSLAAQSYDKSKPAEPQFPMRIEGGNNIVSSIDEGDDRPGGGEGSNVATMAVLTVVDEIPPGRGADVFRPSYVQPDEEYRFVSDLDLSKIPNVKAPRDPDPFSKFDRYKRLQITHRSGWTGGAIRAYKNSWPYPAGHTGDWGQIMLQIATNEFSMQEKLPYIIAMVQNGIDTYGSAKQGIDWNHDGGVNMGRWAPIYFAGFLFDDKDMLSVSKTNGFAEFQQTFYHPSSQLKASDLGISSSFKDGCYKKLESKYQVTLPGGGRGYAWYGKQAGNGNGDKASFFGEYKSCDGQWNSYWGLNSNAWVGVACAARLYGYEADVDDPAYFHYMDRYMDRESGSTYNNAFNNAMWYEYCDPWR